MNIPTTKVADLQGNVKKFISDFAKPAANEKAELDWGALERAAEEQR